MFTIVTTVIVISNLIDNYNNPTYCYHITKCLLHNSKDLERSVILNGAAAIKKNFFYFFTNLIYTYFFFIKNFDFWGTLSVIFFP